MYALGTTNWATPPAERSALHIPMRMTYLTAGQGRYDTATTTRIGHHVLGKLIILRRTPGTTSHDDNVVGCSLPLFNDGVPSCDSRQSVRNPANTRILLYSSSKKQRLGNDDRALRTLCLIYICIGYIYI